MRVYGKRRCDVGSNYLRTILVFIFLFALGLSPAQALGGEGLASCFAEAPHLARPAYAWQMKKGISIRSTGDRLLLARIRALAGRRIYTGENEDEPFETPRAEWTPAFQFFVVSDPARVGDGAWDSVWFYEVASRPSEYYAFGYSWARLHYVNPKTKKREQHPCAAFAVSRGVVEQIIGQMR